MTATELYYVAQKVERRIPTWQSTGLSSGGKMILIESCLSSVPNYTMGIYLLQEEIHHKMDTARANFFLAWSSHEKEISHGKVGSIGYS
jgi:hypothetical protein